MAQANASELARLNRPWLEVQQQRIKQIMSSDRVQMAMGFVIFVAYLLSLIASQLLPEEESYEQKALQSVEYVVTVIFTIELVLNLFGHSNNCFQSFFSDAWLVCDLVVVIFMLVGALYEGDLPAINVIRLVRVFKMVCKMPLGETTSDIESERARERASERASERETHSQRGTHNHVNAHACGKDVCYKQATTTMCVCFLLVHCFCAGEPFSQIENTAHADKRAPICCQSRASCTGNRGSGYISLRCHFN